MISHDQEYDDLERKLELLIDLDAPIAKDYYMYYSDFCDIREYKNNFKGLYQAYERRMEKNGL